MDTPNLAFDKCLVTGAAGFIGSHLCNRIVSLGKQIIGIDDLSSGRLNNLNNIIGHDLFTFIEADITNSESLKTHFKDVDIVFHNACSKCTVCRIDPHKDLMTNTWGTFNVIEMSRLNNVKKIIHASTGSTMNGHPCSFYGVSKLAGELYYKTFDEYYDDFNYSILQYYHVYGSRQPSHDKGGVIPIFIRRINNDEPIIIDGDGFQVRHFTCVDDVVNANLIMADPELFGKTNKKTFQCASDVSISILDLGKMLHKLMGRKEKIEFTDPRPGDIKHFDIDNIPLKSLGITFRNDLEKELKKVIKYYTGIFR